jgi:hypothetical protein
MGSRPLRRAPGLASSRGGLAAHFNRRNLFPRRRFRSIDAKVASPALDDTVPGIRMGRRPSIFNGCFFPRDYPARFVTANLREARN